MATVGDLRLLFYAARLFGCGPHAITEDDFLVTKQGTVYSVIWTLIFVSCSVKGLYILISNGSLQSKETMLIGARTFFSYGSVCFDIVFSVVWNWKLRLAFAQLRSFDRATNFNERNDRRWMTRLACCVFLAVNFVYWIFVGYLSYRSDKIAPVFDGVTYCLVHSTMSLQVMKFVVLSYLVYQRLQKLCEMSLLPEDGKIMVVERGHRQLRLQEVWWLHCCLANACETINSVYATPLLMWIAGMSFNLLSRLYGLYTPVGNPMSTILIIRELLLVSSCVTNLLLVATICHSTAVQANDVGKIVFSPLSSLVGKRNFSQDNVEAATYFHIRKVYFYAGGGLINIDLPLLLSIASGITTYLVILHANNI